jgi:hypothetical protein
MSQLKAAFPTGNVHADLVQWRLTVPAMWADEQKDAMRSAAHQAGLTSQKDSEQLLIILEPEAAAVHARVSGDVKMEEGDLFEVVDAGGGTVDITLHSVVPRNGEMVLSEAATGVGGFYGSTYVDQNFERWFSSQMGVDAFEGWKQKHPGEHVELMGQWEVKKRGFQGCAELGGSMGSTLRRLGQLDVNASSAAAAEVRIPASLLESLDADAMAAIEEMNDGYDDRLLISESQMREFFDPVIDEVVQLVQQKAAMLAGRPRGKVLLVGGISASPYYAARLKQQIDTDSSEVLCSPHAASAVLLGKPNTPGDVARVVTEVHHGTCKPATTTPVSHGDVLQALQGVLRNTVLPENGMLYRASTDATIRYDAVMSSFGGPRHVWRKQHQHGMQSMATTSSSQQ